MAYTSDDIKQLVERWNRGSGEGRDLLVFYNRLGEIVDEQPELASEVFTCIKPHISAMMKGSDGRKSVRAVISAIGEANPSVLSNYRGLAKYCGVKLPEVKKKFSGDNIQEKREYYKSGEIKSVELVCGNLSEKREYDKSNNLRVVSYKKDGKLDGMVTAYDDRGCVIYECMYIDGKRHGCEIEGPQGGKLIISSYKNGLLQHKLTWNREKSWYNLPRDIDYSATDSGYSRESLSLEDENSKTSVKLNTQFYGNLDRIRDILRYDTHDDGFVLGLGMLKAELGTQCNLRVRHFGKKGNPWEDLESTKFTGEKEYSVLNGKVRANYTNGVLNGKYVKTTDSGKVTQANYKSGKLDGLYEKFVADGWKRFSATYKDGKLNGFCTLFNVDGTIAQQRLYKDGKNITKRYKALKEAATKNISPEKDVVTPKQSKATKRSLGRKLAFTKESKIVY